MIPASCPPRSAGLWAPCRLWPWLLLLVWGACVVAAPPPRRVVIQPVHEYFNLGEMMAQPEHGAHILNGFLNYTHLGSDFGFLGPGELHCTCQPGAICADLPPTGGSWAGAWHSLNGLAREGRPLDLRACYPSFITASFQPRVVGVQAVVRGSGRLKLELKSEKLDVEGNPAEKSDWSQSFPLKESAAPHVLKAKVDATKIPRAQYLNWVAEGGSTLCVDSVSLEVELPPVDFPTYVFLASYAKLARCYSEETGLVRDRAHTTADAFNTVPSTGMFALATAAAHRLGIVDELRARTILQRIMQTISTLPRDHGLLPHFVYQKDGKWLPLPGSEYSTIDSTLCLLSLRLAAECLHDDETAARALELLHGIQISTLRNPEGYVLHGVRDNGQMLTGIWRDWGGETALVLIMQRIAAGPSVIPKMDDSGRTHRGIGFIADLPALLLPQFNTSAVAQAGCVDWRAYRQERLAQQKAYFGKHAPRSLAAKVGLSGLSAGEGSHGIGYHVGGVEDPNERLAYPHYVLMSSLMEKNPRTVYDLLGRMEAHGWLPPWGLVENIEIDGSSYLPMLGSLNASFEALSAYHLLMHQRRQEDVIYQAANADPVLRDAVTAIFE